MACAFPEVGYRVIRLFKNRTKLSFSINYWTTDSSRFSHIHGLATLKTELFTIWLFKGVRETLLKYPWYSYTSEWENRGEPISDAKS